MVIYTLTGSAFAVDDYNVSFIGSQFIGGIVVKGIQEGAEEYSGSFGIVVDHGVRNINTVDILESLNGFIGI